MSEENIRSALWRACLYIAGTRNVSQEMTEKIADDLYDQFLKGSENDRIRYEFKKAVEEANEQISAWPEWKRKWGEHYWKVNKPVECD